MSLSISSETFAGPGSRSRTSPPKPRPSSLPAHQAAEDSRCRRCHAAHILARTGDPTRFVNEAAFASYSGTALIEVASADKQRHRLSRSGD
ncbi:transposase [Rhodococcus opacus]|uniref:transposase n=1 Tax=Rhodococcus opacus TaxID=37919 RepID=UPI0018C8BCFB